MRLGGIPFRVGLSLGWGTRAGPLSLGSSPPLPPTHLRGCFYLEMSFSYPCIRSGHCQGGVRLSEAPGFPPSPGY